jgi:cell division inhibitor SepF
MAVSLRGMGAFLGLVEDEDQYHDQYGEVETYETEPARAARNDSRSDTRGADASRAPVRARAAYSRPSEPAAPPAAQEWVEQETYAADYYEPEQPPYRITTLHPRTYNEAVTIGEHFRSGTPVIMNLSEMADSDAKRLVDFAAGLTFGLHGRVERVTSKVFLLSPQNVTVTAQDKARIAENGFFNQS